jgi:mono/diheme cytochrome c family protein
MRAGPRRRRSASAEWRSQRISLTVIMVIALVVFGIGLPAVVLATNSGNREKMTAGGVDLNSAQARGRQIFAKNCAVCHTLSAANAVGKVGPNLDQLRPPKAIVIDAVTHGRARGLGQMPAGLVAGRDLQDVAAFVSTVAGR